MEDYKEEGAKYPEEPSFTITVFAPNFYLRGHSDEYSNNILKSKKEDLSEYFKPFMKKMIDKLMKERRISYPNLVLVVPNSKGEYSPTLQSIGFWIAKYLGNSNYEEIIITINPQRKNIGKQDFLSRFNKIKNHFGLSRTLNQSEKKVIILDDTKVTGSSLLEIEKILRENSAKTIYHLCLSINRNKEIFPL
jgi:predicted amidophosphoribosyltransferase